jgi:hypothetical protein
MTTGADNDEGAKTVGTDSTEQPEPVDSGAAAAVVRQEEAELQMQVQIMSYNTDSIIHWIIVLGKINKS